MIMGGGAKKRVLIVSGEARALAEIKKELRQSFETGIAQPEAALAALEALGADAVVVCAGEQGAGLYAFAELCAEAAKRGAPVLFLAQRDDEGDEASAFAMGASDYAVKRRSGSGALIKRLRLRILAAEAFRACGANAPASPEELLRGKTILIAEDVELNREILAAMLSGIEGLELDFAEDGREALNKFRQNAGKYAMVFLDIHMPEMDGIQAAEAIRRLPGGAAGETPIFALSASGEQSESARRCLNAGMNGFLPKPVDYDAFLSLCAEYLA